MSQELALNIFPQFQTSGDVQGENLPARRAYTLGLDIGIASVGAALLTECGILGLHVRTFNKAETAKSGESLNLVRREARLTRRRLRRRAHRLLRLRRLFKEKKLLQSQDAKELLIGVSPWELRAAGLDRKLEPREWATALYHLVNHRGFQSSRKSESAADEKAGLMLSGIAANQKRMSAKRWRTVGEMAARDEDFVQAKRNKGGQYTHTFDRSDLEHELATLFEAQRSFGNPHSTTSFQDAVYALLMARRQALSGEALLKMVGRCTFEPGEYRAPKASYSAEQFIWLTKLNNLRITDQGSTFALDFNQRQAVIDLPFATKGKITYKQIRQALQLSDSARFTGVDYWKARNTDNGELSAESATLFEAKAFHALREAYVSAGLDVEWPRDTSNPDRLDALAYALTVFKDDQSARAWLSDQGVEPAVIEAALSVSFSEFIRLSVKALRNILPHMADGQRYDEAVQSAGYAHHSHLAQGNKSRFLPGIPREDFTNPVVYRALNQARKLVNAIVRKYGSPSAVHIEFSRDLGNPLEERQRIERDQKDFADRKQAIVKNFVDTFERDPRGDELTKWRLYRDQLGQCPYCQQPLDDARVITDGTYAQIDHAIPYTRSFDDGMNNKVLAHARCNQNKGARTPYEYLGGAQNSQAWTDFSALVAANHNYRAAKRNRLLTTGFSGKDADAFRERNLTDTRYIAKAFKGLIENHLLLAEGSTAKRCVVVSGGLTALLRARWGLLKVRGDGDLHHALDAAVVAACGHRAVQYMNTWLRKEAWSHQPDLGGYVNHITGEILSTRDFVETDDIIKMFPTPWPYFRDELKAWLSTDPAAALAEIPDYNQDLAMAAQPILVSRAPLRRGLGQAHKETIRSAKFMAQGKSAVKTPLAKLSRKDLPNIVGADDPRNAKLIEILRQRLECHGDKGEKAFKEPVYRPSADPLKAPLVRTVNLRTTQPSGIPVRGGIADNGRMLRVDIFTDGKKFYAVPLYVSDTVKPELPNKAVSKGSKGWIEMAGNHSFCFSLHANDFVRLTFKGGELIEGYFNGLDIANGIFVLFPHDRRGKDDKIRCGYQKAASVEKFNVDTLGGVHPVRQEARQPLGHRRQM